MRCVNIDWLEVFCQEPKDRIHDAEYFRQYGCKVKVREYGTPQYREMFTIFNKAGDPFVEVRRNPYSLRQQGGIFNPNDCHVRLCNRTCYEEDPVGLLRNFLWEHDYSLQSLSRVDICLDILSFDDGTDPTRFLSRYAAGDYFKIHLSKIAPHGVEVTGSDFEGHGTDTPYIREYSSWKWGAPTSAISVKLYNKTKELAEVREKSYIRDQWQAAGLISDDDRKLMSRCRDLRYYIGQLTRNIKRQRGNNVAEMKERLKEFKAELQELTKQEKQVWRIEFSINSDIKGFVSGDPKDTTRTGQRRIYPLNLSTIDNRGKCLFLFHTLANRYFLFKKATTTRTGTRQRKDRCPDYLPIRLDNTQAVYRPARIVSTPEPSRMDKIIINKLRRIVDANNDNPQLPQQIITSILDVLTYFRNLYHFDELDKVVNKAVMYQERLLSTDIHNKEGKLTEIQQLLQDVAAINDVYNV